MHLLLLVAVILTLSPIAWVWISSLKTNQEARTDPLGLPERLAFENYYTVWTERGFDGYTLNSLIVASTSSAITVGVSSMAAYAFARWKFPGSNLLFFLLFLGWIMPIGIKLAPLLTLMHKLKLIDNPLALILPYSAAVSFTIILLRAFFRGFPQDLEDAARVDGASPLQFFARILLPISRPALFTAFVLSFLSHWNEFLLAFVLINRAEARTAPIGLVAFQGGGGPEGNLGEPALIFAAITITALPVLLVYLFFQRHFIEGITAGALK